MSVTGIFGGSFDPIHNGHLITAQAVKEIRKLDKIIFIPAFISPLKKGTGHSSPEARIEMLKLAVKDTRAFDYSDIEIQKKGISYTIDTLYELKETYSSIELIIGYDNLIVFEEWKEPDKIFEIAEVVVLNRKINITEKRNKYFDKAVFVDTPVIEISATKIRERVKQGLPVDFLVPCPVKDYILKNNLYKDEK